MRITDEKYWNNRREYFSREVDCLFDWVVFFYLFFFPFIVGVLCSQGGEFLWKIDSLTILWMACFVIGGGIGFQTVKMKMVPILVKISYLVPLGALLIILLRTKGGVGLLGFFFYGISYSGGFLLGDRFNYILWQHQYLKTLHPKKRDQYLLGRVVGKPFLITIYLSPFVILPYGVKLIYERSLANEGQLLLVFFACFLIFFIYKTFFIRNV